MSVESSDSLLEEIGAQALITGAFQPVDAVVGAIDAVTQESVVSVSALTIEDKFLKS